MDHAEKVAQLILQAALPRAVMEFRPRQSHEEYDFDLRYPDGAVAAVEVTSSRDQLRTQTNAEIFNRKKGGAAINAIKCKKSWLIFPSANARIKEIRKNADECLANLEAAGLEEFHCLRMRDTPKCVQDICLSLNLIWGAVFSSTETPKMIRIAGVGSCSAVGATCATEAGEKEANANKRKLGKAQTNERHLVVYIDTLNVAPHVALTDFEPPTVPPKLPDEITHIWLVTEKDKADQFVVWYGRSNETWRRIILSVGETPN